MTGALVNNTNSASAALAVTQSGAGFAATFMGGNVGVGTTSPAYNLDVLGGLRATTGLNTNNDLVFSFGSGTTWIQGSSATNALRLFTNGGERLRVDTIGNVGIGTASPSSKLDVNYGAQVDDTTIAQFGNSISSRILLKEETASYGPKVIFNSGNPGVIQAGAWTGSGAHLALMTNGPNERMRIDTIGNVGIGTTSPSQKLDVNGNISTNSAILVGTGAYLSATN